MHVGQFPRPAEPHKPSCQHSVFHFNQLYAITQGWLENFLQPPSAFSPPRKILNSKFCTYELYYQILYGSLWITYYYIQNTDHLLCSSTPVQNRAELDLQCMLIRSVLLLEVKILTILNGIFRDQNKSLRSTHLSMTKFSTTALLYCPPTTSFKHTSTNVSVMIYNAHLYKCVSLFLCSSL